MVDVSKIMEYEDGNMSEPDMIDMFQEMVNDGSARRLQGHYGRTAKALIDAGYITLPEAVTA